MNKLSRITSAALLAAGCIGSSAACAEVSYNIGFASEYYFRGIKQKTSSASAGIDYESSGFYVGGWAADVGDGLEVDGYVGYGMEFDSGFSASIGYTGYFYTGEFDDTYNEINLNLGYGIFGFEYSRGRYDNFGGPKVDYDFIAATLSFENGFYGTVGGFGDDADGNYIEVGYGTTVAEIDIGVAAIFSSDELSDQLDSNMMPTESEALVLTLGKTF